MSENPRTPTPGPHPPHTTGTHEQTYPVSVGARALGKSERWYIQRLKSGRFPGHKAGRTWFLTASDINAAIEASRSPSSRPAKRQPPPQPTDRARPNPPRPTKRTRHRRYIPPQDR